MKFIAILSLIQIAFMPSLKADLGYVGNTADATISVIDTSTLSVVATFANHFPLRLAITPNQRFLYVAQGGDNVISVYDTLFNNALVATITGLVNPTAIAISPDGKLVYVATGTPVNSSITAISTATNTAITTFPVGFVGSTNITSIVFHPNGLYAYAVDSINSEVFTITVATNTQTSALPTAVEPNASAIMPNGSKLYVGGSFGPTNDLDVISLANPAVPVHLTTLSSGGEPIEGLAITPNGQFLYGSNYFQNNAFVVNTSTDTLLPASPIGVGTNPFGVGTTHDNVYAATVNSNSDNVSFINTSTNTVAGTVSVGTSAGSIPLEIVFKFLLPPPTNLRGKQKKEDFAVIYQYFNQLKWIKSTSPTVVGYNIYRNGILIAVLGANKHCFRDNDINEDQTNVYSVTAFDANGVESVASTVTISGD